MPLMPAERRGLEEIAAISSGSVPAEIVDVVRLKAESDLLRYLFNEGGLTILEDCYPNDSSVMVLGGDSEHTLTPEQREIIRRINPNAIG